MLSINKIKYLKSLSIKKYRVAEQKVLLEGYRIINEAINSPLIFEHIWINENIKSDKDIKKLLDVIKVKKINFNFENEKKINSISNTKNTQGILALVDIEDFYNNKIQNFSDEIIILDKVSDPGNLGTIIRTCAWFNIKSLILTENSADIFNPKCLRSAMGGHFYLNNYIYLKNNEIVNFINLNKYLVYCADSKGKPFTEINKSEKWALILGSEAHGVSKELTIGEIVSIPGKGKIESLNVSVACGILLNNLKNKK